MSWQGIHGHDALVERFRNCLRKGRLASTFLFVGPPGIGKSTFALRLAQSLLCQTHADQQLESCGTCAACQQALAHSHPDLQVVSLPEGKSAIPLELFIGSKDHRMREGLCHNLALKPGPGSRKVAIIDDGDYLNQEGANCLLKTLEEPPPKAVLILIGTSEQRQLPTIRSRAQIVRFAPLPAELISRLLMEETDGLDASRAQELAALSGGSLAVAKELADPEIWDVRTELLGILSRPQWEPLEVTRRVGEIVDAVGKEAPLRRARMRLVIDIIGAFYRQLMRHLSGAPAGGDGPLGRSDNDALPWWRGDLESAADSVQRCLDARTQVDANANQATLLACWIDDLSQIARGGSTGLRPDQSNIA